MNKAGEILGEIAIKYMRDNALSYYDEIVSGKTKTTWHKNLHEVLNGIDKDTKELFKAVLLMVLDDVSFEFLKAIQQPYDNAESIEFKINGTDVTKEPGDIHAHLTYWADKYSICPRTTDLLKKYGTDAWPRVFLKP